METISLNMRLFDGQSWYVTAEYSPDTKSVSRAFVPLLTGIWDITDQLTPDQIKEIEETIKKRGK
jgi:hypothetical protein